MKDPYPFAKMCSVMATASSYKISRVRQSSTHILVLMHILRLGIRCPYFFESTKKVVHSRDIWASSSKYFGFCSLMKLNRFCLMFVDSLVTTLADEYLAVRTFMFRVHANSVCFKIPTPFRQKRKQTPTMQLPDVFCSETRQT